MNELVWSHADSDFDYYAIAGTSLWNTAQVLIRYQTGDLAMAPKGTPPAEIEQICYGLKPFFGIAGRSSEYLETPDGRRLIGINQIPRGLDDVVQMQIVQRDLKGIDIYVVVKADFPGSLQDKVMERARTKIPDSLDIRLHQVDRIERTALGKAPLVVRELNGGGAE